MKKQLNKKLTEGKSKRKSGTEVQEAMMKKV